MRTSSDMRATCVLLTKSQREAIDAEVRRRRAAAPNCGISMGDVVRDVVANGLQLLDQKPKQF